MVIPFSRSEKDLVKLRAIDAQIDQAIDENDISTYLLKNKEFHFTLYSLGETEILMPMIEMLWLQIGPFLRVAMVRHGLGTVEDQHHKAMDAIQAYDIEALQQAIRLDILDGVDRLPPEMFEIK